MSQARSILRNSAVLSLARIIERVSGLVLAFVISRELGAGSLGIYATATAYFGIIAIAGEAGSTGLLIREIARARERTAELVLHTGLMATALSVVAVAVGWFVVPLISDPGDERTALRLILVAVLPGTLNTIQEAVFVAYQRVEYQTLTTFVMSSALVGASLLALERGWGLVGVIASFVVLEYLATIVYFVIIHRHLVPLHARLSWASTRSILADLRPFAGSSLLTAAMSRPEIIILSLIAGPEKVGFYSAALKIVDLFQFIPQVVMTNVYPVLAQAFQAGEEKAQAIQEAAIRYLLALGLPITAGLAATAGPIIETVYGDDFDDAVLLLRILSVNVLFYCLSAVLWRVLAARGEQGRVFRVQVVVSGVKLGLGAGLAAALSALGVAISTPASLLFHVALLARAVREHGGVTVRLFRPVWRFALAAALMAGVVRLLGEDASLLVATPVAIVSYAVFAFALGAVSRTDVERFRDIVRRTPPKVAA